MHVIGDHRLLRETRVFTHGHACHCQPYSIYVWNSRVPCGLGLYNVLD
jgi:hypothetical protein